MDNRRMRGEWEIMNRGTVNLFCGGLLNSLILQSCMNIIYVLTSWRKWMGSFINPPWRWDSRKLVALALRMIPSMSRSVLPTGVKFFTQELRELRSYEDPGPVDVSALQEEVDRFTEDINRLQSRKDLLDQQMAENKASTVQAEKDFQEMAKRITVLATSCNPINVRGFNSCLGLGNSKIWAFQYKRQLWLLMTTTWWHASGNIQMERRMWYSVVFRLVFLVGEFPLFSLLRFFLFFNPQG